MRSDLSVCESIERVELLTQFCHLGRSLLTIQNLLRTLSLGSVSYAGQPGGNLADGGCVSDKVGFGSGSLACSGA